MTVSNLSRRTGAKGPRRLLLTTVWKRTLVATLAAAPAVGACEPPFTLGPVVRTVEAAKLADGCQVEQAGACNAALPAVGSLYVELSNYPLPVEPQCVATLVSPNAILTAAHCLPTESARIVFQLAGTAEIATVVHSVNHGASTASREDRTDDVALAFLDRAFAVQPLMVDFARLKPVCGGLYVLSTRGAKPVCASATRGAAFEDRFDIVGAAMSDPETGLSTFLCYGDSGALVMQAEGNFPEPTRDRALGIVAGSFEVKREWRPLVASSRACSGFAVIRKLQPYQPWILAQSTAMP